MKGKKNIMKTTKEQMIDRLINKIYAMSLGKINVRENMEQYRGMSAMQMTEDLDAIHMCALELYAKENGFDDYEFFQLRNRFLSLTIGGNFDNGDLPRGWDEYVAKLESIGLDFMIDAYVAGVSVKHIITGDKVFEEFENPFEIQ